MSTMSYSTGSLPLTNITGHLNNFEKMAEELTELWYGTQSVI